MDQRQKIAALHSLEGHKSCQPVCLLQLQLLSQSLAKELHIMPQKFPHSEQNEVFTSTFPAGMRSCICHPASPSKTKEGFCSLPFTYGFRMGKKKVAFPFLGGWPTATHRYLLSPGEALLTEGERSSTGGMLPCENVPTLSVSFLSLSFPI